MIIFWLGMGGDWFHAKDPGGHLAKCFIANIEFRIIPTCILKSKIGQL